MEINTSNNCYMSQVCRTCLQQISDDSMCYHLNTTLSTSELTVRQKLLDFLPETNLTFTPNAILCNSCVAAIEFVYKFKKKCLLTEKYITAYIHETVNSVDLSQMIQNHSRDVIDLDKINTTECLEVTEEKDIKIPEIKNFEDFTRNGQLNIDYSLNVQRHPQVVPQNHIQPPEIVDQNSNVLKTDPAPSIVISDDLESNIDDSISTDSLLIEVEQLSSIGDETYEEYDCDQCNYITHEREDFTEHMRTHTDHNIKHRCTVCHFGARYKNSMMLHMMNHTSKKPYKCGECSHQSTHMGHLKRHMKSHVGYGNQHKCSECTVEFKYNSALKVHMIGHAIEKLSKCLKEKFYKCTECNYSCNRKANLKNHIKIHKKTTRPRSCNM